MAGLLGEVYRARDTKLDRDVALNAALADLGGDLIGAERGAGLQRHG